MLNVTSALGWAAVGLIALTGTFGCESEDSEKALEVAEQASAQAKQAQAEAEKAKKELAALKEQQAAAPAASEAPEAAPSAAPRDVPAAVAAEGLPSTVAEEVASAEPGVYSLAEIRPVAENCKSPSVMLAAVSNNIAKKKDFVWAYVVQALYAHPKFVLGNKVSLKAPGRVALQEVQVTPKAVGLVAYCKDGATCNELAAMYKSTVPTSKPEVYCGKSWEKGRIPRGLLNSVGLRAMAFKKLKEEPTSMCARVGICTKQQNPASTDDIGLECKRAPGKYKYKCGQEKTCEAVVACTQG